MSTVTIVNMIELHDQSGKETEGTDAKMVEEIIESLSVAAPPHGGPPESPREK
jgi:hypothetical protein